MSGASLAISETVEENNKQLAVDKWIEEAMVMMMMM